MNKVDVAPAIPLNPSDRQTYSYKTDKPLKNYAIVTVPVGSHHVRGVVMRIYEKASSKGLKPIKSISRNTLSPKQIKLSRWIAKHNHGSLGYTLRLFLPGAVPGNTPGVSSQQLPGGGVSSSSLLTLHNIDGVDQRRWRSLAKRAHEIVQHSHQVLLIVPEIHMISPLFPLLKAKLGEDFPLHIVHSHIKPGLIKQAHTTAASGDPAVFIGTQKSLFLPYSNLKAIILDQAFYSTHKLWDAYPRLDNRIVAEELARIHQAGIIYAGSIELPQAYASPSVNTPGVSSQRLPGGVVGSSGKKNYLTNSPLSPKPRTISPSKSEWQNPQKKIPSQAVKKLQTWSHAGEPAFIMFNRKDSITKFKRELTARNIRLKNNIVFNTSAGFIQLAEKRQRPRHVMWIWPEQTLRYPDYRSEAHAWETLARLQGMVSAREPVHLVTRSPRLIQETLEQKLEHRTQAILKLRKKFNYPPYSDIARLTFKTKKLAEAARNKILRKAEQQNTSSFSSPCQGEVPAAQAGGGVSHGVEISIKGPFQDLAKDKKTQEHHLLLIGDKDEFPWLYKGLKQARVDLNPERIL